MNLSLFASRNPAAAGTAQHLSLGQRLTRLLEASLFRRWTIAARITALVLTLVLPLNIAIFAAIWRLAEAANEAQRSGLEYASRSVANEAGAELDKFLSIGQALARSPALREDKLDAFEAEARRTLVSMPEAWVVVGDLEGNVVVNTALYHGQVLLPRSEAMRQAQVRAFESGLPSVTGIIPCPIVNDHVVYIVIPVFKGGKPFRALTVAVRAGAFLRLLDEKQIPAYWVATIIDGQGRVVARSSENLRHAGQFAHEELQKIKTAGISNVNPGKDIALVASKEAVESYGWSVAITVPKTKMEAAVWGAIRNATLFGVGLSTLSLLLAGFIARRITEPLARLRDDAARLLAQPESSVPLGPPEVVDLWSTFKRLAADRRRIDALRKSEERLRHLGDSLPDSAVYRYLRAPDGTAKFQYISAGIEKLNGVRVRDVLRDPRALYEQVLPEYLPQLISAQRISARDLSDFHMELPMRRPDGEVRWMRLQSRPERLPDGSTSWDGILADITEKKQAEEALRESEQRLRLALDAAELGVWKWDGKSEAIEWDMRCKALFGLPPEAGVTAETWLKAVLPEDRLEAEARFERAADPADPCDDYFCDFRVKHSDGKMLWLSSTGRASFTADPTFPGGRRFLFAVGMLRDITERRNREWRDRYLLELDAKLRDPSSPQAAVATACEALGEELGAFFAGSGKITPDGEQLRIDSGWSVGDLTPYLGSHRLAEADMERVSALVSGQALIIRDFFAGPNAKEVLLEPQAASGGSSVMLVPLMRDSEVRSLLVVARNGAQEWTEEELSLAHETAGRMWHAKERARAESELRASEERLRLANDAAGIGIFTIDLQTARLDNTPKLASMIGFPGVESVKLAVAFNRVHREDMPRVRDAYISAAKGENEGQLQTEFRFVKPGGEIRWLGCLGRVEFSEGLSGPLPHRLVAACIDITKRRAAEAALRASEERFRGVYENAATGIAITDPRGQFISCNRALAKMLGCSVEEVLASICLEFVHPSDRRANENQMQRLAAREIPSFEIVNRYQRKDGKIIWVQKHLSLLKDETAGQTNIIALVTDITDRKRHEEHVDLLMREVNHRSKNILTVVQAIARQTAAATPADFLGRFEGRLRALASNQDLLVKNEWKGVKLSELIRSQLAHFDEVLNARIEMEGPELCVSASAAQAIGMATHELATNAAKYGALSVENGRVEVGWRVDRQQDGEQTFSISWREHCPREVHKPSHRGFGSTVIADMVEISLQGRVELDYQPTGLFWRAQCPLEEVVQK